MEDSSLKKVESPGTGYLVISQQKGQVASRRGHVTTLKEQLPDLPVHFLLPHSEMDFMTPLEDLPHQEKGASSKSTGDTAPRMGEKSSRPQHQSMT